MKVLRYTEIYPLIESGDIKSTDFAYKFYYGQFTATDYEDKVAEHNKEIRKQAYARGYNGKTMGDYLPFYKNLDKHDKDRWARIYLEGATNGSMTRTEAATSNQIFVPIHETLTPAEVEAEMFRDHIAKAKAIAVAKGWDEIEEALTEIFGMVEG